MSDIDTAVVDSLKVLDPKRPIREATENQWLAACRVMPEDGIQVENDAVSNACTLALPARLTEAVFDMLPIGGVAVLVNLTLNVDVSRLNTQAFRKCFT